MDPSQALQIARRHQRLYALKYSRRGEGDRHDGGAPRSAVRPRPRAAGTAGQQGSLTLAGDIGRMLGWVRRDELEEPTSLPSSTTSASSRCRTRSFDWRGPARRARAGHRAVAHHRRRADPPRRPRHDGASRPSSASTNENWDGSGLSGMGLAGEDIPLGSRMIRACNVFVAIRHTLDVAASVRYSLGIVYSLSAESQSRA